MNPVESITLGMTEHKPTDSWRGLLLTLAAAILFYVPIWVAL